jgi:hypothetical protein
VEARNMLCSSEARRLLSMNSTNTTLLYVWTAVFMPRRRGKSEKGNSDLSLCSRLPLSVTSSDSFVYSGIAFNIINEFFICPVHPAYMIHLLFCDLITIVINGKNFEVWISSLRKFIQPPLTSISSENVMHSTL